MTQIPPAYYLVLDYGKLGRETVINWEKCSKADIMDVMRRGDYNGSLISVGCIDMEFGLWSDASEDIAQEILDDLREAPHGDLFDFLEQQLGVERLNHLREVA